jgi:hypothetical protein
MNCNACTKPAEYLTCPPYATAAKPLRWVALCQGHLEHAETHGTTYLYAVPVADLQAGRLDFWLEQIGDKGWGPFTDYDTVFPRFANRG